MWGVCGRVCVCVCVMKFGPTMNHHMHLEAKDNDRCSMFTLYCARYKTFPAERGCIFYVLASLLAASSLTDWRMCSCSQKFSDQASDYKFIAWHVCAKASHIFIPYFMVLHFYICIHCDHFSPFYFGFHCEVWLKKHTIFHYKTE